MQHSNLEVTKAPSLSSNSSQKDDSFTGTERESNEPSSTETYPNQLYVSNGAFGEQDHDEIDVLVAIEEFNVLKKELSRVSQKSSAYLSRKSSAHPTGTSDLEKGVQVEEDEGFNLSHFMHGMSTDQKDAGHELKHLGVIWRNLSVEGLGAEAHTIPTIVSGIAKNLFFWRRFTKKSTKVILKEMSGFAKDGEMLLILGRPGAGCTTLLKIISNMRKSFTAVKGTVRYGGIDHDTFARKFHGQTCYNSEEDQHYPTLSVKQTLQFALRTKTPGNRLPNESRSEFINKILFMLGNMLGLTRQMNTMVGNHFIRGISGGERKRLSIAEQMTTQSTINCWDCSTRGLDAASALDFIRSLRIMTDVFQKTTVATLYQASDSIYQIFDNIILLDEGHLLYFGPSVDAKNYFEELGFYCPPRKSTPDFLTGLCNPLEREIKAGYEDSVPITAKDFQDIFYTSKIYKSMMEELDTYEEIVQIEHQDNAFRVAMEQEHQKRASNNSPFIASYYQQVIALTIREYHLVIKDRSALISRYGTVLIQALITASCFYNIPNDGSGAFSRGGALFFCVIFNSLVSQSELVRFLMGRPILEKHKQYALYRPSAYYIAQMVMDIPFALVQVLLFELCVYFIMGLTSSAGAFFIFFITLFFLVMCINGFFRLFGAITTSFFVASQTSGIIFVALVIYCGYVIPKSDMHPWLSWIYWISPIGYGYKTLLINEMKGKHYTCEGSGNSVPYGPGYEDWNYRVCTMTGGEPGASYVLGDNYLEKQLSWKVSELWAPDFVAVVGFFIVFTIVTALAMEFIPAGKVESLTKLYIPGKAPKHRTAKEEADHRRNFAERVDTVQPISDGTTFSWQDVNYTVPIKGGELQLLNGIGGIVRPGHLTALMGSSGAGKTTLLDVLAKRKTIGKVEGSLYLNGEALINDFERITGYCEQMDIHQPAVTVREALQFSANLRQPYDTPQREKDDYVNQIIHLLEMEDIADAQIGDIVTGFGISVEERKRLTIGIELVGKPQLLFLDEPTSGLDAQSSYNIIRFIRKLADAGWPVLCTIHQPSSILFQHFDQLLLLVRGGRTAYFGDIGQDARTMIDYFERHGGPVCSPATNPAEYILEVVGAGTAVSTQNKYDWADIWDNSSEAKVLKETLDEIHENADQQPTRKALTYASPLSAQFYYVLKRMSLAYWRSPDYNIGRFVTIMASSLITGFTYWKLSNSQNDLQNRMFALFSSFLMANILIIIAQPKFMTERIYFRREYASRFYSWIPFGVSAILVEVPYILFIAAWFMFAFYWTVGLVNTSETVGYFYLMSVFFVCWAVTLGFVIAAVAENPTIAAVTNPLVISILVLFSGFMQPVTQMPKFWSSWVYWLNPFHYFIEGLAVNELNHIQVECRDKNLLKFLPPPGQTCGSYTENFFSSGAPGYIANPNATQPEFCGYCAYKDGSQFYSTVFGWDYAHKYRNLGIIIVFFVFNMFCFTFLVWWKRKAIR